MEREQDSCKKNIKECCDTLAIQKKNYPYDLLLHLHSAWVKHNTDTGGGGGGRKILAELSTDNSVTSVCARNLSPNATELCLLGSLLLISFVHKRNLFANVESSLIFVTDTFNLNQ